ncbi:MAG: HK97-gp10 family putative phage morphogenesis protein [Candidatus Limiplasma sp.]|nr:HK97-gp10 family putative phage morphogenesis protein [Candidatus Limiplasma sp.]
MSISINVEGLDAVLEGLTAAVEGMIPSAAKGMEKGLAAVKSRAQRAAPHARGELEKSIAYEVVVQGDSVTGEVGSNKEYAVYVEMGTGPVGKASGGNGSGINVSYSTGEYIFQRKLKNGKVVRFVTDGWVYPVPGGGFRFTRGQPARPFLYPAWKANKEKVLAAIRNAIKGGLKG